VNASFAGCYCNGSQGGATDSEFESVHYENCAFLFCEAYGDTDNVEGGGALRLYNSGVNCTNCSFTRCASKYYGGAVFGTSTDGNSALKFIKCIFNSNNCSYDGGGIYCNGGTITCENCSFVANEAGRTGAGMAFRLGTISVTETAFVENLIGCTADGGAAVMLWGTETVTPVVFFSDCSFGRNLVRCEEEGMGMLWSDGG
jgi:predicted outer membrane repeat protein